MSAQLVDFSFVYEMAENDAKYAYEVISLFLNTLSDGMVKLEKMINDKADFDDIRFQSHFLKSSAKLVKVNGMYDGFFRIENMARENKGRDQMVPILESLMGIFKEAKPVLETEVKKNKKAMKRPI